MVKTRRVCYFHDFISISISLSLFICMYIYTCIYIYTYIYIIYLSIYLSIYLCIYLCIYLSIYLSMYLSIYILHSFTLILLLQNLRTFSVMDHLPLVTTLCRCEYVCMHMYSIVLCILVLCSVIFRHSPQAASVLVIKSTALVEQIN